MAPQKDLTAPDRPNRVSFPPRNSTNGNAVRTCDAEPTRTIQVSTGEIDTPSDSYAKYSFAKPFEIQNHKCNTTTNQYTQSQK